jgi:hypothetical protein
MSSIFKYTCIILLGLLLWQIDPVYMAYFEVLACVLLVYDKIKSKQVFENLLMMIFCVHVAIAMLANIDIYEVYRAGKTMASYPYAHYSNFPESFKVIFIGYNMILCGLEATKNHALPKLTFNISESRMKTWYHINLILILQSYFYPINFAGTFNYLLSMVPLISIFFFVRIGYKTNNEVNINRAYILLIVSLCIKVMMSFLRSDMIAPLIIFVMGVYMGAGSLKPFKSARYTPLYIFAVIFIIYFEAIGQSRTETFDMNAAQKIEYIAKRDVSGEEDERLNMFQRTSSISQISACLDLVDKNGFYNGEMLGFMGVALVPRFLWPSKPTIALGTWFAYQIGAAHRADDGSYNNSVNMTVIGHVYLDFGLWGVIIGCLLIGVILQQFWYSANFYDNARNFTGTMLGGFIMLTTLLGIGADLQILVTILGFYLVLAVFNFIVKP